MKAAAVLAHEGETIFLANDTDLLDFLYYHVNRGDGYNILFSPHSKVKY